jgi:hypothetical protein
MDYFLKVQDRCTFFSLASSVSYSQMLIKFFFFFFFNIHFTVRKIICCVSMEGSNKLDGNLYLKQQ